MSRKTTDGDETRCSNAWDDNVQSGALGTDPIRLVPRTPLHKFLARLFSMDQLARLIERYPREHYQSWWRPETGGAGPAFWLEAEKIRERLSVHQVIDGLFFPAAELVPGSILLLSSAAMYVRSLLGDLKSRPLLERRHCFEEKSPAEGSGAFHAPEHQSGL